MILVIIGDNEVLADQRAAILVILGGDEGPADKGATTLVIVVNGEVLLTRELPYW